jgi:hypothetical protein
MGYLCVRRSENYELLTFSPVEWLTFSPIELLRFSPIGS